MKNLHPLLSSACGRKSQKLMECCLDALEMYLSAVEHGEEFNQVRALRDEAIQRLNELEHHRFVVLVSRHLKL